MKRSRLFLTMFLLVLSIVISACTQTPATFTINFDSSGGSQVESVIYDGNDESTILDNPTKEGYVFDGWYWDNGTFTRPFTANSLLNEPIKSDLTVYAKWILEDSELTVQLKSIYQLSLQANIFEGTYEEWLESVRGPQGVPGEDGKSPEFRIDGKNLQWKYQDEFIWNTLIDLSVLYGQDEVNADDRYSVTFNPNGGHLKGDTSLNTAYMSYLELPIPQKLGYKFLGWFTGEGPNDMKVTNFTPLMTDLDLIAKWEIETYNITFDLNGGMFQSYYGSMVEHWSENFYYVRHRDKDNPDNSNYTVYYTVLLEYFGIEDYMNFFYISNINYDNHIFFGWYDNPEFEGNPVLGFGGGQTGNKTFYAKWEEDTNPYRTFIPEGGSITSLELDEYDANTIINKFVIANEIEDALLFIYESYVTNKFGYISTYVIIDIDGNIIDIEFISINQTYGIDNTTNNLYSFIGTSIYDLVPQGDIISGATGSYNSIIEILNDLAASHLDF